MAFGSRERLQRLALEAEITAKEKAAEKAEKKVSKKSVAKKKTRATKASASGGGMKMVWRVLDPKSKVVATFPFPKEDDAIAKAAQLTGNSGEEHRVQSAKVPRND